MLQKLLAFVGTALLLALLAACTPETTAPANPTPPAAAPGMGVNSQAEFVAALQNEGATVEEVGRADQPFLQVSGQALQVNRQEVQVFEFDNVQARRDTATAITMGRDAIVQAMGQPVGQVHIWGQGRLIVLYVGQDANTIQLLNRHLNEPIITGGPGLIDEDMPAAVAAAVRELSDDLAIAAAEFRVVTFESAEWPDGCMGLARADEMCTQALVPGWRVILEAQGQRYEVRTDMDGRQVRWQQL